MLIHAPSDKQHYGKVMTCKLITSIAHSLQYKEEPWLSSVVSFWGGGELGPIMHIILRYQVHLKLIFNQQVNIHV